MERHPRPVDVTVNAGRSERGRQLAAAVRTLLESTTSHE